MKRYLLITAALSLAFSLLVGLFNYQVDPYAIYRFKQASGDTLSRIEQFYHMRVTKPWHILQGKPSDVVIGTSRTARVPPHPTWPQQKSYNLSVPGMTVYEMSRFIEHAQANGPLKRLMIGLDFQTFIRTEPRIQAGFEEHRLARNKKDLQAPAFQWQRADDVIDTLLSLPGFTRSLSALSRTASVRRHYFEDGTWETASRSYTGRGGVIYIGKGTVFAQRNEPKELEANVEIFADTLRFAHKNDIETRLFITPEHIFVMDLWFRLGYEDIWNDFHRRLIEVNNAVAAELGKEAFPLFGFSQARGIVDEPIEKARNATHSFFEDGTHFRKSLGERIMSSVWHADDDTGFRLSVDSVDSYLIEVNQVRMDFEESNSAIASSMRRTISPTLE